jgi:hypothetical protein
MRQFNTLVGFLDSKSSSPALGDTAEFQGFADIGDGGGGTWKHNGVTGQTPSQSPSQLNNSLLNDASGNQWAMLFDNEFDFETQAEIEASLVANIFQSLVCREIKNSKYIIQPTGYSPAAFDILMATGLYASLQEEAGSGASNITKLIVTTVPGETDIIFAQEFESVNIIINGSMQLETDGAYTVDILNKKVILSEPMVAGMVIEAWFNYNTPRGVQYFTITNVTTPYTLQAIDSGSTIVFDDASDVILNIPDGLFLGTASIIVNIGGGSLSLAMTGADTIRGAVIIGDVNGQLSVQKLAPTIWQSSER